MNLSGPVHGCDTPHPMRSADTEIRRTLRRATHDIHVLLDHHPLLAGITKPGYLLRAYQHVLIGYFHLYQEMETEIERALLANNLDSFDYLARRKHGWLAADLAYFDVNPYTSGFYPTGLLGPFPTGNAGQLVGMLYAIEGSTLGGRVIAKHLAKNLKLTAHSGARFFNGYEAQTPQRWSEFEEFMNTNCTDAATLEQACFGARVTFLLVEGLLNDYYKKLTSGG